MWYTELQTGCKMSLHAKNSNAVSVALKMARSAKAHGGQLKHPEHPKHPHHPDPYPEVGNPQDLEIKNAAKIHKGAIHSPVAGRTDHLPMHVDSGSYVIPADIISAMGEGNTLAGFKIANSIFEEDSQVKGHPYASGKTPYGANEAMYNASELPYGMKKAHGGETKGESAVPIIAAGGEYVLSPKSVLRIGNGNLEYGHKILDSFVKKMRAKTIKTLQKLPGPKKG